MLAAASLWTNTKARPSLSARRGQQRQRRLFGQLQLPTAFVTVRQIAVQQATEEAQFAQLYRPFAALRVA